MKNTDFLRQILEVVPSGAQTLSKNPAQYVIGVTPAAIMRAKGAYIWDTQGKKYLDMVMALGAISLGYADKNIDRVVRKQMGRGTIFSLPSPLELNLAEKMREVVPCAGMSRFYLNGNDATSGAIRLARHITGRDHIVKCGYHGWQDWSICTKVGRNLGVPEIIKSLTHDFIYNDISSLKKIFQLFPKKIAAVIMEPVNVEPPRNDFLKKVAALAHKNGALFIFDEMVTGFRWSLGGAQEYFNVIPDLACFGKAISNGYPLSVLCGKKKYMEQMDKVFVSTTFGGFTLGLAAAIKTIETMQADKNFHAKLHRLGEYLITNANKIFREYRLPLFFKGYGVHPMLMIKIKDDYESRILKTFIYQTFNENGVLFNVSTGISRSHTKKEIEKVLRIILKIAKTLNGIKDYTKLKTLLKGDIVKPRLVR